MPQIICHECGETRVVTKGKRKNCRKCGAKLTDQQQSLDNLKAKTEPQVEITIDDLVESYPNQVAEIVKKTRADLVAKEFGDMEPADIEETFPSEVAAIKLKATNEMGLKAEADAAEHLAVVEKLQAEAKTLAEAVSKEKKDLRDAVKKAKMVGRSEILKMSDKKIKNLQSKLKI